MSKLIVGSAVAALALGLMASPGLATETIQQKIVQGSNNGVSYSYLTTGTNDDGSGANDIFRLEGNFSIEWNSTTGEIEDGSGTLDVYSGSTKVGELKIHKVDSDSYSSNGANEEDLSICFELIGGFGSGTAHSDWQTLLENSGADYSNNDFTSDQINVGFLDKEYKAGSGFNSYGKDSNGNFSMSLWGNEDQHNGGWGGSTSDNWGLDWRSVPVPLPSPVLLGLAGLGMVWVRKRRGA